MLMAVPLRAAEFADVDSTAGIALSPGDQALTRQALSAARNGRWNEGMKVIGMTKNPLASRIFYWLYYTKGAGPVQFHNITTLIRHCPGWPKQGTMRLAAEKAMPANLSDEAIIAWYKDYPPKTFSGLERYLAALQDQRMTEELRRVTGEWWRSTVITPDQQKRLFTNYRRYISERDHLARINSQLMKGAYTNARTIARMVGRGYPALVEARIALAEDSPNVNQVVDSVPPQLRRDPGLMFERLRWRRKKDYDVGAMEILHNMPPVASIPNLEDWGAERQILARRLMEKGQYSSAYLLVSGHKLEEGQTFAQAEFLAGWLALERLKKPGAAFSHFENVYKNTVTPLSRSRGAYWAGRASDALGHPEIGRSWYQVAGKYQTTFYGQLAIAKLDAAYRPPKNQPPARTLEGQNRFNKTDMVQAARLLNQAGFNSETTDFLNALSDTVTSPEEYLYLAELSRDLDHIHNAVKIAKNGLQKDIVLMDEAFPTILQRMKNVPVEWALVHALIRQESAFDRNALSPAGARGLMQLMPGTARETAGKIGMNYFSVDSLSDPDQNIRLGSAYLKRLIDRYDGSYPLALAAYNGGPGRVDKWVQEFGDPRTGDVDILDWIEQIPVSETRNYVQRVLEAVYIYRIKLHNVQESFNAPIHVGMLN